MLILVINHETKFFLETFTFVEEASLLKISKYLQDLFRSFLNLIYYRLFLGEIPIAEKNTADIKLSSDKLFFGQNYFCRNRY